MEVPTTRCVLHWDDEKRTWHHIGVRQWEAEGPLPTMTLYRAKQQYFATVFIMMDSVIAVLPTKFDLKEDGTFQPHDPWSEKEHADYTRLCTAKNLSEADIAEINRLNTEQWRANVPPAPICAALLRKLDDVGTVEQGMPYWRMFEMSGATAPQRLH